MERIPDEATRHKLIAKYGADHDDFDDLVPEPEPVPDRVISVTLNEAEQEVLDAIFVSLAWPDQEIIKEDDWDMIVALAKKLGAGDLNQL
jgi:hypothetical protein